MAASPHLVDGFLLLPKWTALGPPHMLVMFARAVATLLEALFNQAAKHI